MIPQMMPAFKRRISGCLTVALGGVAVIVFANISWALDLPAEPLLNLRSEEFHRREAAQADLLVWARAQPQPAMDALFQQSQMAADPEVRERCLAVLRDLVHDEYLTDGEGFLGIRMQDEIASVPGDPAPRSATRVIQLVGDSAARHAGLLANDLIVGLGEDVWREGGVSQSFTDKIRQMKPRTRVVLKVLRDGQVMAFEVILGRRPFIAEPMLADGRPVDLEAAERVAKESYFNRWLARKKSSNSRGLGFGNRHP